MTSPRPWKSIRVGEGDYLLLSGDAQIEDYIGTIDKRIGANPNMLNQANAQLIISAVNAQEEWRGWLQKASQLAKQQYNGGDDIPIKSSWNWLAEHIDQALKLAEGEK